jgi:hypothetical protein
MRRLVRLALLVGLPVLLLPFFLPRKLSARRPPGAKSVARSTGSSVAARETQVQGLVDELKERLAIPDAVAVSIVAQNSLLVSVERQKDHDLGFALRFESDFLDGLSEAQVEAVVAHELGHVWIFTHHPYLQTEELANEIALRVVSRESLDDIYEKVWAHAGPQGDLVYLPPPK